jgi:hypothetical protein
VEEVCALPLVDTVTRNEAAGVEVASVGNEAAGVETASVVNDAASVEAASVDTAAAVVGATDSKGQQPSEPSES